MDTEMSTKPVDIDEFLTNIEKKDLTAEEKKILDEFIKSFNASLSQPQKENPDECAMQLDDPEPKEQDRKEESVKEPEIPTLTLTPPLDEEEKEKEVAEGPEQAKVQLPKDAFGKNETKGDLLRMQDKMSVNPIEDIDEFLKNDNHLDLSPEEKTQLEDFIKSIKIPPTHSKEQNQDECAMQVDDPELKEQGSKGEASAATRVFATPDLLSLLDEEKKEATAGPEPNTVEMPEESPQNDMITDDDLMRMMDEVIEMFEAL